MQTTASPSIQTLAKRTHLDTQKPATQKQIRGMRTRIPRGVQTHLMHVMDAPQVMARTATTSRWRFPTSLVATKALQQNR